MLGTGTEGSASVVYLDEVTGERMWTYLRNDSLSQTADEFGDQALPPCPAKALLPYPSRTPHRPAGPVPGSVQDGVVAFLLGSTWLALHVLVVEHGFVLVTAALCGIAPVDALLRRTVA